MPAKPPTPEAVGDTFVVRHQYQAAIAAYAKDPNPSAAVWNKMGLAYQMLRNLKGAAHCYKAALKLDPHNSTILNNMGTLDEVRGNYGQAERMYRRALKYRPPLPHSHASAVTLKNLGTALLSDGKYDKGWEAYRKAVALDPGIFANTKNPSTKATVSVRQRGATDYFIARGCARTQHIRCAVRHLRLAFDEGFTTVKKVIKSGNFAGIRKKHAFQELLAEERQNP